MADGDGASNLPAVSGSDEVVVSFHDEGLLVGGDPVAVESYLQRLRHGSAAGSGDTVSHAA